MGSWKRITYLDSIIQFLCGLISPCVSSSLNAVSGKDFADFGLGDLDLPRQFDDSRLRFAVLRPVKQSTAHALEVSVIAPLPGH